MASIHQIALLDAVNTIERNQGKAYKPITSKQKDISDGVADYIAADKHNQEIYALTTKDKKNKDDLGRLNVAIETAKKLQNLYQEYKNLDTNEKDKARENFKSESKLYISTINKHIGEVGPQKASSTVDEEQKLILKLHSVTEAASFTTKKLNADAIFGNNKAPDDPESTKGAGKSPEGKVMDSKEATGAIFDVLQTLEFAKNTMDTIMELEATEARIQKDAYTMRTKFNAHEKAEASGEISEDKARKNTIMQMFAQSMKEEKSYQMLIAKMISES